MSIIDVVKFVTNEKDRSEFVAKFIRVWKPWSPSDKVINFVAVWESGVINGYTKINGKNYKVTEGMVLEVYTDSRGLPTVGCGHLVLPEDKLKVGDVITLERAHEFFIADQKRMIDGIHNKVKVALLQREYDAIFSMTFNGGAGGALNEIAAEINKGKYDTFPAFIRTWRAKGNLAKRREAEAVIFESGVYDATH